MLKDSDGKALTSQQITSMTFATTKPPRFDCEIFTDSNKAANALGKEEEPSSKRSFITGTDTNSHLDRYLVFVIYHY
jgi:hypothetical protein